MADEKAGDEELREGAVSEGEMGELDVAEVAGTGAEKLRAEVPGDEANVELAVLEDVDNDRR